MMETAELQEQQEAVKTVEKKVGLKEAYNEKFLGNFTQKEMEVLRNTIAKGTSNEEFMLFVQTCVNTKLNPFLNHIYCIVYEGRNGRQFSIQIAAEGVLCLARKQEGFLGVDAQLVHENDEFEVDLSEQKIVKHTIGFPRGRVMGGYAIARKEGFKDKILLMDVSEVESFKNGSNAKMWNTYFNDMFRKHMLKRVAKEQYGIDVTEQEVSQTSLDELPPIVGKERKEITPEPTVLESKTVDEQKEELWDDIVSNMDDGTITYVMKKYFKEKTEEELNPQELVALKKFAQLEMKKRKEEPVNEFVENPPFVPQPPVDEITELNSFFD